MTSKSTTTLQQLSRPSKSVVAGPRPWTPHEYQLQAAAFMLERRAAGILLDPGAGKTSISYAVCKMLKQQGLFRGAIVAAPRRPAVSTWPQERDEWTDFHDLTVALVHGHKKEQALQQRADIYIVTHEGLNWLADNGHLEELFRKKWVDTLFIDELSKYKHVSTGRFKKLEPWLRKFTRRYGLTGSPAANGLLDLFGQTYTLDLGTALGPYMTWFRAQYFVPIGDKKFPTWVPVEGGEEAIYSKLSNVMFRVDLSKYLKLPKVIPDRRYYELPDKAREVYDAMEEDMVAVLEGLKLVTAQSAAAASMKCRQLASGAIYDDLVDPLTGLPRGGKRQWHVVHDEKLDAMEELIAELQGHQLFIAYDFGHDRERILERLGKDTPCIGGGTSDKKALAYERAWNAGELPILLGHPNSVGHGLNFQRSGAHHILWFTLTWNYELFDQFNKRLNRQGTSATHIFQHYLVGRDTVEESVLGALGRKRNTQNALFEALLSGAKASRAAITKTKKLLKIRK